MIVLKKLKQTCSYCPAQWEGTTVDDRPVYIRYRWGTLTCQIGPIKGTTQDAVVGEYLYDNMIGDNLDGCLGEALMLKLLDHVICMETK